MRTTTAIRVIPVMIALIMGQVLSAQVDREERRAELEAKRVAFITEEADLSPKEAEAYWPLVNELQEKKRALRGEKELKVKKKELDNLSEADLAKELRRVQESKVRAEELELEYVDRFIAAIGAKKLHAVHKAEREFRRTILKEMRSDRNGDKRRGGPGPR